MKNTMKCLEAIRSIAAMRSIAIIALIAIVAFSFTACGDGNGGGKGARDAKTYTGTAEGVTYTLKIEDGGSRAVLTPKQGDKYTLTQNANTKKSTGTVTKVVGGVLTLAPKEDPDDEFTATVSGDGITAMSGTITWDDGTANEAPVTLTPSGGIDPGPGPGVDSDWKWTAVEESTFGTGNIYAVAYGNNRFVAGGGGKMAYSDDGASWTAVSDSKFPSTSVGTSFYISAIAYGNNRFVAVGYVTVSVTGKIAYSDDNGETWTAVSNSTFDASYSAIRAIAYGNNRFVAVGEQGKMAYSSDGVSWTAVSDSKFPSTASDGDRFQIRAIAYGNNRFVAVGDDGKMAYSTDGASWTAVANSTVWNYTFLGETGPADIGGIAYGNNRFIAGGGEGKMAYSDNGTSWTAVSSTNIPFSEFSVIDPIAYGNNRFVAVSSSDIAYSANGASWTAVAESTFGWDLIWGIAYGNNRFVAVGDHGKIAYADW